MTTIEGTWPTSFFFPTVLTPHTERPAILARKWKASRNYQIEVQEGSNKGKEITVGSTGQ